MTSSRLHIHYICICRDDAASLLKRLVPYVLQTCTGSYGANSNHTHKVPVIPSCQGLACWITATISGLSVITICQSNVQSCKRLQVTLTNETIGQHVYFYPSLLRSRKYLGQKKNWFPCWSTREPYRILNDLIYHSLHNVLRVLAATLQAEFAKLIALERDLRFNFCYFESIMLKYHYSETLQRFFNFPNRRILL